MPADAALSLPAEKHSHGLRRLAALEAARGSYDDACAALGRATGQQLPKRQVEQLAARAAVDFESFYAGRRPAACDPQAALAMSCDGKGVVMRPGALRPVTGKRAQESTTKLQTRLSKGEKRNRKRIAEVGAVYDIVPAPRTAADVLPAGAGRLLGDLAELLHVPELRLLGQLALADWTGVGVVQGDVPGEPGH